MHHVPTVLLFIIYSTVPVDTDEKMNSYDKLQGFPLISKTALNKINLVSYCLVTVCSAQCSAITADHGYILLAGRLRNGKIISINSFSTNKIGIANDSGEVYTHRDFRILCCHSSDPDFFKKPNIITQTGFLEQADILARPDIVKIHNVSAI